MQKKGRSIKSDPFFKARFQKFPCSVQSDAGSTGATPMAAKTTVVGDEMDWVNGYSRSKKAGKGTKNANT
jgi:hypothetical protein